jgi:hypothetical protein
MLMILELLWTETWWRYDPNDRSWVWLPYHYFNLFEGMAWLVFSILVVIRCSRKSRSKLELLYALSFFTFAWTDFREAFALSSWLIWVKLANLIILARMRAKVIRRYYPESRLY